jgi:hypothetical protein
VPIVYWDEEEWVSHGYFFELLLKGDINNPIWKEKHLDTFLISYINGAAVYRDYLMAKKSKNDTDYDLARYLIERGYYDTSSPFRRSHYGYKVNLYYYPPWNPDDFNVSPQYLQAKYGPRFQKTLDTLFLARKPNVLWLGLSSIVVYFLSLFFIGAAPSLLVATLFGLNNLVIEMSLRAQTDGLFLFLFNLGLLSIMLTLKKNRNYFLVVGLVLGLLWQTKLNGIMLLMVFNTVLVLNLFFKWFWQKENKATVLLVLLSTNILAFLVFVNTNLYLMQSPIKNTISYYQMRIEEAKSQVKSSPEARLDDYWSRIHVMNKNMTLSGYYVGLSKYLIPKSISVFTSGKIFLVFYAIFVVLGIVTAPKILLVIFVLTEVIMSGYLFLNWDRYFIQLYFFYIFFFIHGLFRFFKFINYLVRPKSVGG